MRIVYLHTYRLTDAMGYGISTTELQTSDADRDITIMSRPCDRGLVVIVVPYSIY